MATPTPYDPVTECVDGPDSWHVHAWEPFFKKPSKDDIEESYVQSEGIAVRPSKIVPSGKGSFAKKAFSKGDCVEWGCAILIPSISVHESDAFFAWSSKDRGGESQKVATCTGCALYYNTMGDESNCRMVPYHKEQRFEVFALRDIEVGEELTIRYDSMNWREAMTEVRAIVGELKGDHHQA